MLYFEDHKLIKLGKQRSQMNQTNSKQWHVVDTGELEMQTISKNIKF